MSRLSIQEILKEIEDLLAQAGDLPAEMELAVEKFFNLVEAISSDRESLADEIQRLKELLEKKKKEKTTGKGSGSKPNSNHSSEKKRGKRQTEKPTSAQDRRTFKDLTINETIECPVDPETLPPDAVQVEDEEVVVQDIQIEPRNIRFVRSVYYSSSQNKFFRGALPSGYDQGDFGADLRALILSLKYCGNMSEPKIREFLPFIFDKRASTFRFQQVASRTS